MVVLSAAPRRALRHPVSVLAWAAAHVLILAALFSGIRSLPAPHEPAMFEVIELAAVPPSETVHEQPATPMEPDWAAPEPAAPKPEEPEPAVIVAPAAQVAPVTNPNTSLPPALDPVPAPSLEAVEAPTPEQTPQAEVPPRDEAPAVRLAPVVPVRPPAKTVRPPPPHPLVSRPVPRDIVVPAAPPVPAQPAARLAAAANVAVVAAQPGTSGSEQRAAETLRGRIREAVQAAVRCPAAARMMGLGGKAGVAFDYRDGAVMGGVQLTRSAGAAMLDTAALAAVRDAHYPKAPPEVGNHMLRLLIWVEEACGA
jgi:periplasmic protein TonB